MTPPTPGLRQLFNKSNDVAKVQLVVPAGDEIHVTDYVAGQLPSGAFAPATDETRAAVQARRDAEADETPAVEPVAAVPPVRPAPVKAAAKKAGK